MSISYLNGFELNADRHLYTIGIDQDYANPNAWVPYTTDFIIPQGESVRVPRSHVVVREANISTNDNDPNQVDSTVPVGAGKHALSLSCPANEWVEFFSPPNLLDQGLDTIHGTGGLGLKRIGFRFFWKAPSAFEVDTDQLVRFYDGTLKRAFITTDDQKPEGGNPLFRLKFKDLDGNQAGLVVRNHNDTATLGGTDGSCFTTSEWHQIAIIVRVGPSGGDEALRGLIVINVDGQDVVTITDADIEWPANANPAQAIEYFSFLTSNISAVSNGDMVVKFDSCVVYDYWDGLNNAFAAFGEVSDQVKTLNQMVQGVYPVNLEQANNNDSNDFGNWTLADGGNPDSAGHLAIQGDDNFTPTNAELPENPIAFDGTTFLKTDTVDDSVGGSIYSVDTWDRDMVNSDWNSHISEIRAIRVINVCKTTIPGNEKLQLTFNAEATSGATSNTNTSSDKVLSGTEFQIISNVWDHNPDAGGAGNEGSLNTGDGSYVIDSLRVGLKVHD